MTSDTENAFATVAGLLILCAGLLCWIAVSTTPKPACDARTVAHQTLPQVTK